MTAVKDDSKFVRVYYRVIDDPKFETIYSDDHHFATWVRLLLVADAIWPASSPIPSGCRRASLNALVAVGLVDLMPQSGYRIHGLDAERERRATRARNAAAQRWQSGSNASALPEQSVSNAPAPAPRMLVTRGAEQSRATDEQVTAGQDARDTWNDPEGEALTWLARHGCDIRPGNGYHQKLILAVENHGINAVVGMFDRLEGAGVKRGDVKGYLFGAIDALNGKPDLRGLEREDRADEEAARLARSIAKTKAMTAERERQASQ